MQGCSIEGCNHAALDKEALHGSTLKVLRRVLGSEHYHSLSTVFLAIAMFLWMSGKALAVCGDFVRGLRASRC